MICYRDRTYCGSKVEHHTCGREFTEQDHADAVRWWGSEDYPLALGDFCSKPISPVYNFFTAPEEVRRPIVEEAIKQARKEQGKITSVTGE